MAQGAVKKSKPATPSRRPAILGPKKGLRAIAPKKAALVKQRGMTKKHSAGLISKTERNLAEKAGHLEMLKGGKSQKKGRGGEGKKPASAAGTK
ncbi:Uncharacterised protein family UPF0390 [Lasallia pustulata]|uniref:Uncharacterized protein family UPF0390 n=1 Tax=Lasallia pustulata TaxID=136370 RepID=A0A1W5D909_9LECA|nr:Uncharacterised protein family UPF0390 [Lasallia pustulata]